MNNAQRKRERYLISLFDRAVKFAGGRCVDEYGELRGAQGDDRADYVFDEGRVVGELKCLVENAPKFQANLIEIFNALVASGQLSPPRAGEPLVVDWSDLPDDLQVKLDDGLRRTVKKRLDDASRQIRAQKERLEWEDAFGVLFIVNDGNFVLPPQAIKEFASDLWRSGHYSSVDLIIASNTLDSLLTHPGEEDPDCLVWVPVPAADGRPEPEVLKRVFEGWVAEWTRVAAEQGTTLERLGERPIATLYDLDLRQPEQKA